MIASLRSAARSYAARFANDERARIAPQSLLNASALVVGSRARSELAR
jgi:hypothetical protein